MECEGERDPVAAMSLYQKLQVSTQKVRLCHPHLLDKSDVE